MSTRTGRIHISNLMIDTVKKDIKNMHLGVYPPNGRVRIAAPLRTSDETIRLFVISRMPWIKKQQLKFLRQERESPREYVTGESHYFLGKRYRLNVIPSDGRPKVEIRRKTHVDLHVKANTTTEQRRTVFDEFYRSELKKLIAGLVDRWEQKVGVHVREVKIRRMKTRWGTCNDEDKRVWLNLELAKKPLHCIDYVFVHELVHLIEKHHTKRFLQLLELAMPNWEHHKAELNEGVLSYFTWECNGR